MATEVYQPEKIVQYIGNKKFCWEDSTAMLLSTIGENISPSFLAAVSGCGLSAFFDQRTNWLYFNFAIPNEELGYVFQKLGFSIKEVLIPKSQETPLDELRSDLKDSPAVVGPIDMGFLGYNPDFRYLMGSDHFVLVYGCDQEGFFLHDPAGYPCVFMSNKDFTRCLESRDISYGSDHYRYWTKSKRVRRPSKREIFDQTMKDFKSIYVNCDKKSLRNGWITGERAILMMAERIEKLQFNKGGINHLVYFSFPQATQVSLAVVDFLSPFDGQLAQIKGSESRLLGMAQIWAMKKEWDQLSATLRAIASLEVEFRLKILAK